MVNRREKEKRQLRYASAKERAEKQEGGFGPSAVKIPKEIPLFSFKKAGVYRLSILPYVAGKGNRFADEGFVHYERTYYTHRIGTDNKQHCCLRENFHKPCPVCEYMAKLDRWGKDKDLYSALRPKQRQLFALEDMSEKGKGIQIFETNYFFGLGEFIDNKVKANPDKYSSFYHLKGGMILEVSVKQDSYEGRPNYKVKNIEMEVDRKDLDESLLDDVPCLDDLLVELPYKEMKEIFLQTAQAKSAEDEEEEETPKGRGSSRHADEEDEEDSRSTEFEVGDAVIFEGDPYTVIKLEKGGGLSLEDDDGTITRGVDPDECKKAPPKKVGKKPSKDEDGDDEEEETPKPKSGGKKASKVEEEDEEEEDEDEDDEDDDTEDEDEELDEEDEEEDEDEDDDDD